MNSILLGFSALDNVVLAPHAASGTVETRAAMDQLVIDNLAAHSPASLYSHRTQLFFQCRPRFLKSRRFPEHWNIERGTEFHPESMRFTSDCVALEGFRVVVRKTANEGETSSGRRGIPVFGFACCAVQGKGRACFTFQNDPKTKVIENQISMLIPPNQPFHASWRQAAGMVGTFEIHPRFFEEVLRGAGLSASRFRSMPPLRLSWTGGCTGCPSC